MMTTKLIQLMFFWLLFTHPVEHVPKVAVEDMAGQGER
jgi:hypothetical protein